MFGRMLFIYKRSNESIYQNKAKRLSGTTSAIAKLEELYTYIGSNREKANIAIAILKKKLDRVPKIIWYFEGTNNIFVVCMHICIIYI